MCHYYIHLWKLDQRRIMPNQITRYFAYKHKPYNKRPLKPFCNLVLAARLFLKAFLSSLASCCSSGLSRSTLSWDALYLVWHCYDEKAKDLGRVFRKPVNSNRGLKANHSINFSCLLLSVSYFLFSLRLLKFKSERQKYKQKTSPKSRKTQIKILVNPELA